MEAEGGEEPLRRPVVRLGPDPDLAAAELAAPIEHGGDHRPADAATAVAAGGADLVDVQLGDLVGMAMDDRRALADDKVAGDRDDQVMTWLREKGGEPVSANRPVEDPRRDPVEQGSVGRSDAADVMGNGEVTGDEYLYSFGPKRFARGGALSPPGLTCFGLRTSAGERRGLS